MSFFSHKTRRNNRIRRFTALESIARGFVSGGLSVLLVFILAGFVNSQIIYAFTADKTEYILQTLKIIPSAVSSNSWSNVENALSQDLSADSLVQSFSSDNSAFISFSNFVPVEVTEEAVPEYPSPTFTEDIDSVPVNSQASGTDNVIDVPESFEVDSISPVDEPVTAEVTPDDTPVIETEVTEPEQSVETTEPEPQVQSVSETTVLRRATESLFTIFSSVSRIFPFAVTSTSSPVAEEDVVPEIVVADQDEVPVDEVESESVEVVATEEVIVEEETVGSTSVPVIEPVVKPEVVPVPDVVPDSISGTSSDVSADVIPVLAVEDLEEYVSQLPPCLEEEGCQSHELLFEGFGVPDHIENNRFVETMQVRLSLGSLPQQNNDAMQRLRIEYTFEEEWSEAGLIDLTQEAANSINGGYFLFALPSVKTTAILEKLKIRLVYEGDVSGMEELSVDALWIEVSAGEFFEPENTVEVRDQIDYPRLLAEPALNEFTSSLADFAIGNNPEFTLQFKSQKNFISRVFNSLFGDRDFDIESVQLTHPVWGAIDVDFDVVYLDDNTWTLKVARPQQKMRPGKYTIELEINEGGKIYTDTFEFYWGVLAINTTKSMYTPGEDVTLNFAALTDKGDTICNGDLRLTITDPLYNINEVPISESGYCGPNNVTDVPDYVASFGQTAEIGEYVMQLQHFNADGELVHKIVDSFEVREYIPFDIERTAPTRIYPPAPYTVTLHITANREFNGVITERLPRGFELVDAGGGALTTLEEFNLLSWEATLSEGEELTLTYAFDAPDVSPYLYLLGPLDMDGFKESRQWQIASDALGGVAWLSGTQTTAGTDLNGAAARMLWSTSTYDGVYFAHSTSTESYKLDIKKDGDYLLALTVPQERTDGNSSRTRIGAEVRVNGVAAPAGYGRSSYIRNANNQNESSSHVQFMLDSLQEDDFVEVYLEGLTTVDAGDDVIISGQASMYVEYIAPTETVFAATSTQPIGTTTLNQVAPNEMVWSEIRQDTGFVHSNSINPEDITISSAGSYLVTVNIPLTTQTVTGSSIDERNNILGQILLDGVQVPGGQFAQGYMRGPETESDADSSIHWSGIVTASTTNQILSISVQREAIGGEVIVTPGTVGSIFIQKLPSTDIIILQGRDLSGGTDWSNSPDETVLWDTRTAYDSGVFTHSTTINPDQITVDQAGDYLLVYNDALNSTTARGNVKITVEVDGVPVSGAETKSQYTRDATSNETSGSLTFLLSNLASSSVITVHSEQEGQNATFNDSVDAMLMLWKKAELNLQPDVPTTYDIPFDNIRFSSTTPAFEFSAYDPDGSSGIIYEISWATTTNFIASTTRKSNVDTGFTNTASSTDLDPFIEGDRIRYQIQSGDALSYNATYYWRVRARDVNGSDNFSDWTEIQSFTVVPGVDLPDWYQTTDGQFDTDILTGAQTNGNGGAEVAIADNTEVLIAYGEGTSGAVRYRFWNGTAWGIEDNALDVGAQINIVVAEAATTRDEYIVGTLDVDGDVNFQVYSASTTAWSDLNELTNSASDATRRGLAVTYETNSGDAMTVACDGDADPVYGIWNGTTWSATGTIDLSSANNCEFLKLASNPISDEIIVLARDTGSQYEAQVWDGDAWSESQVLGSMQAGQENREGMALAYEESGNQALVITSNNTSNNFLWNSWNGTSWGANATEGIGNDFDFGNLKSDVGTDRLALCYIDSSNDIGVIIWDGDAWGAETELTTTGNNAQGRPVDCEFETTAGRDGYIVAPYGDTGTVDGDYYQYFDNTAWSGELPGSDINDAFFVQTARAGDGLVLAVHSDDEGDQYDFTFFNGTDWSSSQSLETNPSVTGTPIPESFMMAAQRYKSAVGTVLSTPITHASIPNQATWGDAYFSTTETAGTDVKLQVYYTSVTTCDTLVPNGDLAGNAAGFDVTASPINISGLATTTYSELCLQATLSQSGGTSPTLDEWRVTWQRTSYVTQNYFRWFVNGSFFTPTDAWPAGVSDLAENVAISDEEPVDNGDVLRLRMSLLNENIDFGASSDTFKLQYADAATCSLATEWFDVGDAASTTALWRGYGNSIVGGDWYDANWGRRIEITVDNTLVNENLTDFPVYVDLADLPTGFFQNVQSDGDDIRITESDGLTELAYELVSINTGAETGELHFKADLASTTDTRFFVYYDNASASGYSAGATFGSENVWTNNFSLRYALDDNPTGSSPQFLDSTSNSSDAVARAGMTSGDVVAGQLGDAINLDGNDGGTLQTPLAFGGTYTISTWWRSTGNGFAVSTNAGANEKIGPWTGGGSNMFFRVLPGGSSDQTVSRPSNSVWHHVVITRDSSNKVDFYVDGAAPTRLFSDVAQSGTANWENFGGQTSQGFVGDMDELRFASVKRSDGWITTEFNNQSNATGFYAVSNEELVNDGRELPSALLSVTDVLETYEEENPTALNPNTIPADDDAEWDFVLHNNNASSSTEYCFRMVYEDGGLLDAYAYYPKLITNAPPKAPNLSAPFDNEQLASTTPFFEFAADDAAGDEVTYQIQVDDDYDFGSTVIDRNSIAHFSLFENLGTPSDKDPFTSGQTIRFKTSTTLSDNTTYWWRVRALDPSGSNTYGDWSVPDSFTVDVSTTITTWLQTVDEQFETNALTSATTTGSNSVQIDSSGATAVTILDGFTTGNTKVVSEGNNRLLVVGVHSEDSVTNVDVSSVTYGGQTLMPIDDVQIGGGASNGLWVGYLDEADLALASDTSINVSWVGGAPDTSVMYSSVVFENVSQTDPVPDSSSNSNTGSSSIQPTASVAASNGDMTAYFVVSGSSGDTHAEPGDYTEGTEQDNGLGVAANAYKTITSGSAEQPTATMSDVQNRLVMISLVVNNDASGEVISTPIDFDDRDTGNAWGQVSWNDTETDGTILYRVEYYTGSAWVVIPDNILAGNTFGTSTSPINLLGLDTDTYNQIRLVADMSGDNLIIQDWTVEWGQRVETPTAVNPFDNAKVSTSTPLFTFTTTDPESDNVEYQFSFSSSSSFIASTTYFSGSDPGFASVQQPASSSPFTSGDSITYRIQPGDALTSSSTNWWKVRARDPGGSNQWSLWSSPQSFTVDESIAVSVWFQTTGEQFQTDTLLNVEGNTVDEQGQISTVLREAFIAYGEGAVQSPRYQVWDGSAWGGELTAQSVGARIEWTVLKASPTRDEYALATLGTDGDTNIQIYNGASSTWDNLFELDTTNANTGLRGYDVAYETSSGDLMAVACQGNDAVYSIWNGSSWSATSSLSLTNANTCLWVKLASDPVSDELILVTRNSNAGSSDYEAQVWNGSSWGNAVQFGEMGEDAHEGIAVEYEESGGQAVVVVSDGTAGNSFIYDIWNGSSWAGSATHAIGDDFEWGQLTRDVGSDNMALCYIDQDNDIGLVRWTGSSFQSFQEFETAGNDRRGRAVSCQFETTGDRDGYIMLPYSDNGAAGVGDGGKYQFWDTSTLSGEFDLGDIEDSYNVNSIRTGNDLIMAVFFDDVNDRYDFTYWNGSSWSTAETIEDNPSVTGTPFHESLALAARIYPAYDSGTIRSTTIDYDDGTGPRWEQFLFSETTPGASSIRYQLYYQNATSTFVLIPDTEIPGNSIGTTTSPVSLAGLDRTIYNELQLQANFICDSGDCPSLQDWSVEWSEGITVSGVAYEYDESTPQTGGTVALAVNGVLQSGKTSTIAGDGTWSIKNVTVFEGDTVLVFIDGVVADADEALAATQYDGNGDISGLQLSKRHLTIGSNDTDVVVTNNGLSGYDSVDNENVFFTVAVDNTLTLCGDTGCADNELKVLVNATYQPGANSIIHDFENAGTVALGTTTLRVSGSYVNNATTTPGTGTVLLTATSSTESIVGSSTMNFYNLTFGEVSGNATWTIPYGIDVNNSLAVTFGTLARATNTITVGHNLSVAANGSFTGIGTTTFDGTGTSNWSDASVLSSNIGNVVIDGTSKTIAVATDVAAQSITIGANDVLRGGAGNVIDVVGNFINNNNFVDDTSTLNFTSTSSAFITANGSDLYNVTFTGVGGNWSFTDTNITIANNITIATGTVTLPTGITQVGGSFENTGGYFAHNNGTTQFTSAASGKLITLIGDSFYNAFYNASFTGSGAWSFTEVAATTTNNLTISAGTVTFPSGSLTVGADVTVSGSGAISHNNGELILLVQDSDTITTNGSPLNDVTVRSGGVSGSWLSDSWLYRIPITIDASQIDDDLTDFPVYVDLADLSSSFFSNVKSDGGDIRVTESDGTTEVAREIVSIDTGAENGELYFQASSVSSTTDSVFYIYYGNAAASDYAVGATYGAENVWSNGYVLVAHMDDLTTSTVLNSADGSANGTKASANNPVETTTGKIYEAQDNSDDHITTSNIGLNATEITISAWFNADDLTGSGDNATYGFTIFSAHSAGSYTWLTAGGGGSSNEIRFCAFSSSPTCNVGSGSNLSVDKWHYVSAASYDGGAATTRIDGTEVLSFTSDGGGIWNSGSTIGDLRADRNIEFEGELDEIQISNVVRSVEWQDATYRNQATTTDFYTASAQENAAARTFTDTNVTVLGNMVLEVGGDSVFPSGVLSVGGSFDNNATFDANNGTVEFDSSAGSETMAAGDSSFSTLIFDSVVGDFTITENATATVAAVLTNVGDFTLNSGLVLESLGTFTNNADGASTTWTGSTLKLSSGSDFALNSKSDNGDVYATLQLTGDTDVSLWNSSATVYDTQNTSSIYSQDHAGVDGDLYIFGDYERTAGVEHWSYATDFDGASLSGSERPVNVRVENGASVTMSTSTLSVLGGISASTTVDSQSGTFALTSNFATVTAQYFEMTGTDANGFNLTASSTVTSLDNALFTIGAGVSSITVDASTIDTNPASQFFNTNFVTGGGSANVTLSGSPNSYWWFRNGQGNRYGEAFDNADLDPGAIRWDDSSYNIVISGTVYADDGVSTLGGPTCDGVTNNVRIVVDGGTYTSATSCNGANGSYTFPAVSYVGDPSIIVYLDTAGGEQGSVVTKTPTGDVTNLDIYANRIITRHEDVSPLTIADMSVYDNADDADIQFTAATGTTDSLVVLPDTELHLFATTTFTPGGAVTLQSGGTGNPYDGSLHIGNGAVFTGAGTTTYTVGGSISLDTNASFVSASSSVVMTATTSGKTITAATGTIGFYDLSFTGVGGGWNINSNILVNQDIQVATGTVTGTADITIQNGSFYGDGLVSLGGGVTTLENSNTLGGNTGWTFNDLTLGSGLITGTTTPASNATTTVGGVLTISTGHYLDSGSSRWNLTGSGAVFVENGTFFEDTSTVTYGGTTGSTILSTDYYNLVISADGGTPTFTFTSTALQTLNDFTVTGSVATVADLATNDPVFQVGGDIVIATNGTLIGSDSTILTALGSWDNDGVFTSSGGEVDFGGTGAFTIAAGNSSFADLTISGIGAMQFTENATSTGVLTFSTTTNPTVNSAVTLAVGGQFAHQTLGANTTWTGSTLYLYGGDYEINASTTADSYATLHVGPAAAVRMWNSTAATTTVESSGSLYSMNHAGVSGDLYIFGDYVEASGADYWSYATDFDGTDLSGGNERQVEVYIEGGGSVRHTGGVFSLVGSSTATTTIQSQGSGTYAFDIAGTAAFTSRYFQVRDIDIDGITFSGTPTVSDLSYADLLVQISSGAAVTVGGTVIDTNPAKNFQRNIFNDDIGVTGAVNIRATGTSVSSWRNTNHVGDIAGEAFDDDPDDDPGYLVWDDSAAIITISGRVYQSDTSTVSSVCDDTTTNIRLAVDGVLTSSASSSCSSATGAYSISGISFSPNDTLTLYIDGESVKAANISIDPVSSIGNMHLYENHVIVRHENTDPITIADLNDWDSDNDADIPFTAEVSGAHSVTLPVDTKMIIWNNKEFAPNGDVIISGGGAGAAYDGTLELLPGATFTALSGESHSIGGSLVLGTGSTYDSGQSLTTFTTTGTSRTIDLNEQALYDVVFNGSGSWLVTDSTFTVDGDVTISSGSLTLPSGTSTFAGSFENLGGSFIANNGLMNFTAIDTGNDIEFGGSDVHSLTFNGAGGAWTINDINATTTDSVTVSAGSLTLPSGTLSVGDSFANTGTLVHNSGEIRLTKNSASANVTLAGEDLYSLTVAGGADFTMTDASAALFGDLTVASGTIAISTTTLSIGGSLDATGGILDTASGTILFNSADTGETINLGVNTFYNVAFGNSAGGWTIESNATTTNNFNISAANTFVQQTGTSLYVGNVFTNYVGGAATNWTGSELILGAGITYEINTKTLGADTYGTLTIENNTDISAWNSSASVLSVSPSGSFYSQDNAGVNGDLYIYGDYHIGTTTEYWSYATDFDGAALGGSPRQVHVYIADIATTTIDGGALQIVGVAGATTTVQAITSSQDYAFALNSGTLNASYYSFENLDLSGLNISSTPSITGLSNGSFLLTADTGSAITVTAEALNANASKVFGKVGFNASTSVTGFNVRLTTGTTSNAWRFTGSYGDISGELFDSDGATNCGSIRWSDSSCLLVEQTHYRWRNDDGGLGVPNSEWFDTDWGKRKRVRITNQDAQTYSSTSVKMLVTYDSDMQSDFDDLRFTDNNGITEIPYWVERYTGSTNAVVWVLIPSLPASSDLDIYMYYDNVLATSTASSGAVFIASDDFEDGSISEYTGDTGLFTVGGSFAYGGAYGLDTSGFESSRAPDGIGRTDQTVSQGEIIRYMQYIDTGAGSVDEACGLFGIQSVTGNTNYGVCLEQYGTDRMTLARNVESTDSYGGVVILSTIPVSFSTGWYEIEIDWQTNNTLDVSLYTAAGTLVATTSATDSTYTSGGYGFTYWGQNGGWDSFTSRTRVATAPSVIYGAEQVGGGASWNRALDLASTGFEVGDIARLRMSVENSGLDITDQEFLLEYAEKGAAPSCESVAPGGYASVPPQASCGSSPLCMVTSSNLADGDTTFDLLEATNGVFTAGKAVEDPSNITGLIDVDQNEYTELEYVLASTVNATADAYCLRVSNNGIDLDSYASVAEFALQFDPSISAVSLNGGADIALTPGATTTVYATGTVTDLNGYTDLAVATSTIYRSGAGALCAADDNDCYISSAPQCTFTNCSGNSCTVSCTADIYFHADATDVAPYEGEEWLAYIEVADFAGGIDIGSAPGVELLSLRALQAVNSINYGALEVSSSTGSYNPTTTIQNIGNIPIDIDIEGTDLTDGLSSQIPASQQLFATSSFNYTSCVYCTALSTTTISGYEVDLAKPTSTSPPVEDTIFWGIAIPFGIASNPHSGVNTIYATDD